MKVRLTNWNMLASKAICLSGAILLSACATKPEAPTAPLTQPNESFIQVTKQKSTWCYTRVIEGMPKDEICQKGDFIRYSPEPHPETIYRPIPGYVMALFGTMSAMQAGMEAGTPKSSYRAESKEAAAMRLWATSLQN